MKKIFLFFGILYLFAFQVTFAETNCDEIKKEYYHNGQVQYERCFKNGKRHGLTQMFSKDGKLWQNVVYINGIKEGEWHEYFPSGKLKETRIYQNDTVNGIAKKYYEDGRPEREMMWVNNSPDGNIWRKFYKYYKNGTLKQVYAYDHGKLVEHKEYDENGNLVLDKTSK